MILLRPRQAWAGPGVRELLGSGRALEALDGGGTALERAARLHRLAQAADRGEIEAVLGDERAVLEWAPRSLILDPPPQGELELSRFALLHRAGGYWCLEAGGPGLSLRDPVLVGLWTGNPCEVRDPAADALWHLAHVAGCAVSDPLAEPLHWEVADWFLHHRSRAGHRRSGATWPLRGLVDPGPTVRERWPGTPIPLATWTGTARPLDQALVERRSVREPGPEPVSAVQLGALLNGAAGGLTWVEGPDGRRTRRPYPSGGARYPLEIYLAVGRCEGLQPGLYHYDPEAHDLVGLAAPPASVRRLLVEATVGSSAPDALLITAARFARVSVKYEAIAYSLLLKEVGALMMALQLVGGDVGVGCCPVGRGRPESFAAATGLDPMTETSVGEVALVSLGPSPGRN